MPKKEPPYYRVVIRFKRIVRSTDKSLLVMLKGGYTTWFPKKHITIDGDKIKAPLWLILRKYQEGELKSSKK
jgi:hypothetical protein